tara:strand:- start:382 stop:489 length:108 start_codon:yes stop_codon:yes gene_type:complete
MSFGGSGSESRNEGSGNGTAATGRATALGSTTFMN